MKLGGLGLSSLGVMNEVNQIEASKTVFEKVGRIYEALDPGKEEVQSVYLKRGKKKIRRITD